MLKRLVALLLGLALAAPAAPQGIPSFVPANTVVGRLASNPGPTSAIPFATLAAQLGVGSTYLFATNVAGTNAITATTSGAPVLSTNQTVLFIPANTNTAAATFNRDSTGAVNIFNRGAATIGGEIKAGIPVLLVYDGTQYNIVANGIAVGSHVRTRTVLTSGSSATYTTPTGATTLNVRMCGAGGGGQGSGSTPGSNTDGADTTFGASLTAGGGKKGTTNPSAGGTATGGDVNIVGGQGGGNNNVNNVAGGQGGNSAFGGAGTSQGQIAGGAGAANSCSGGGGGGQITTANAGGGGAAGGYVEKLITSPSATYTYTIGTGGTGAPAGSGGQNGGNGGSGIVIVDEFYN